MFSFTKAEFRFGIFSIAQKTLKGYRKMKKCAGRPTHLEFSAYLPQHFLYFLPLPQGHGSLRPTFGPFTIVVEAFCAL